MSTTNNPITDLQTQLGQITQVGTAVATQVDPKDQVQINRVAGYVNLGIAVLPVFGALFHSIGDLFHHMHKTAVETVPTTISVNNK